MICATEGCHDPAGGGTPLCDRHEQSRKETKARLVSLEEAEGLNRIARITREVEERERLQRISHGLSALAGPQALTPGRLHQGLVAYQTRLPFLHNTPVLSARIPFYGDNLLLFGSDSSGGKSSLAMALTYGLIRAGKRPVVVTTESSRESYLRNMAKLKLGPAYAISSALDSAQEKEVVETAVQLSALVDIFDSEDVEGVATTVEGIKAIQGYVLREKRDAMILDYISGVRDLSGASAETPVTMRAVADQLNVFRRHNIPQVVFAQLHPSTKQAPAMEQRLKLGRTIWERATYACSFFKDAKRQVTYFQVEKTERERHQQEFEQDFYLRFNDGAYSDIAGGRDEYAALPK